MELWKRKLSVFLHDPPEKCMDIGGHEEIAEKTKTSFGLSGDLLTDNEKQELEEITKACDHFTASADRFVFPMRKCSTAFSGQSGSTFKHPMSSQEYIVKSKLQSSDLYSEILSSARGSIESEDAHKALFLLWRRWCENALTSRYGNVPEVSMFPADSRIPDHSIWNHIAASSAVSSTYEGGALHPALLLFQFGPVQDFISQARSTRDMWSGSYLLSWLIAHALKAISDAEGPDSVIFPNLRGNGIFDALHKDTIYSMLFASNDGNSDTLWQRILKDKRQDGGFKNDDIDLAADWLLTPTLPNRFLALVPAKDAEALAKQAEGAMKNELKAIGEAVWKWIEKTAREKCSCSDGELADWKERWDNQLDAFLQITWAVQPWLDREECLRQFKALPINQVHDAHTRTPFEELDLFLKLGESWMPLADRDSRYYSDPETKSHLNNSGVLWSAHYALVDAKLAARRNTREFGSWADKRGYGAVKDSLSGKEEAIGSEAFWKYLHSTEGPSFFSKENHQYGAMNMIKRLWCRNEVTRYLADKLGLSDKSFGRSLRYDSVQDVAKNNQYNGDYVAVIAMDGDEMGKWVSGTKTPLFLDQLSANAQKYLEANVCINHSELKQIHRVLTPSYHLQFSEALANFATYVAAPIVEAYRGQLIYAGGDDVLAMVPADRALDCAADLRKAFRGEAPECEAQLRLYFNQPGYVATGEGRVLALPGNNADVSCGIAIGHQKAPLQMLVQEARRAENRAKHEYGRSAVAISVYKRSGEILQWGFNWASSAIQLMDTLTMLSKDRPAERKLSARFPYALAQFLAPFRLDEKSSIDVLTLKAIIQKELETVIRQQGDALTAEDKEHLSRECQLWLEELSTKQEIPFKDFIMLFLTTTFLTRQGEV